MLCIANDLCDCTVAIVRIMLHLHSHYVYYYTNLYLNIYYINTINTHSYMNDNVIPTMITFAEGLFVRFGCMISVYKWKTKQDFVH